MTRVLIVDDEVAFASVVASYFTREGYQVSLAHDGPSAVEEARAERPDVVLLDLMLPGFDGIEVCRRLRGFTDAYILMLTARSDEVDTIVGLSVGADDYVVKPASPRELLARTAAMLRRPRSTGELPEQAARTLADLVVDPAARTVRRGETEIELTPIEFDLLATLTARPRAAVTRRQLVEAVWGADFYGDERNVDVHIGHLRRKLGDDPGRPRYIRTVRGTGYGLVP